MVSESYMVIYLGLTLLNSFGRMVWRDITPHKLKTLSAEPGQLTHLEITVD